MGMMASQITNLTIGYSTVYSGVDQRKHQSSVSLAFVRGIRRGIPPQMACNAENVSIWWRHMENHSQTQISWNHIESGNMLQAPNQCCPTSTAPYGVNLVGLLVSSFISMHLFHLHVL